MKQFFKILFLPVSALAIYIVVQFVCMIPFSLMQMIDSTFDAVTGMSLALLVSSVVTAAVLILIKPFGLRKAFSHTGCSPFMFLISIFAAVSGMFATELACEQLELENTFEDLFIGMSSNIYGMLAIGIAGPIAEEIVFRGAMMAPMLRKGIHPWVVIVTSALVFGIVHWNPVQIPFAFVCGLLLAIIYYRTGSLVATSVCHIINNSISVCMMHEYGAEMKELEWADVLGSTAVVYMLMAVCAVVSVVLLVFFYRNSEKNRNI